MAGQEVEAMRTRRLWCAANARVTQGFVEEIRQAVWSVNSNLPVASVSTMQEVYDKSVARTSFTLVMLGIAGAMSIALGVVGNLRRDFVHGVAATTRDRDSARVGGATRECVGDGTWIGCADGVGGSGDWSCGGAWVDASG